MTTARDNDRWLKETIRQWPGITLEAFGELHDGRLGRERNSGRDLANVSRLMWLAAEGEITAAWDGDMQFYLPDDAKAAEVAGMVFCADFTLRGKIRDLFGI